MGQKLLRLGFSKWAPPEQFFAVFSENIDFIKKKINTKIFSIKFAIKERLYLFMVYDRSFS